MAHQLTPNAIQQIWNNSGIKNPTVQIMDIKPIQQQGTGSGPERYRLVISDGTFFQQAMLATQLNHLVTEGSVQPRCLVTLSEYICNKVHDRQIAIILNLLVAHAPLPTVVGSPVSIENVKVGAPVTHTPMVQPPVPAPTRYQPPPQASAPASSGYGAPTYGAPPSYGASSAPGAPEPNVFPIASLNPYQQNWRIKARVCSKGDVKTWANDKGSGKLLKVELLDAAGGRIQACMFNDAVDVFDPILQRGKTYYFSGGQLKIANKKWNTTPSNYEITFDRNSVIQSAQEDSEIPQIKFNFVPIAKIMEVDPDTIIDVLGVIRNVEPVTEITTRKGSQLSKRDVTLVDSSRASITLTLWGKQADEFDASGILAIQGAKVSDYNQRSLSTTFDATVVSSPDILEAHRLRGWYDTEGITADITELTQQGFRRDDAAGGGAGAKFPPTPHKTLAQITDEQIGRRGQGTDGAEFVMITGTITTIKHDSQPWYDACGTCNKKVGPVTGGTGFFCERCNKSMPDCVRRYVLRATCCDHTGSTWVNGFDEQGLVLLGHKAQQLYEWKEAGDPNYERAFEQALFKEYLFKVKVFEDSYNDERRLKMTLTKAFPKDNAKMIARLQKDIERYAALGYSPEIKLK